MYSQLDLPTRYETIFVHFEMPGNDYIWWETTVNTITLVNNSNIRAYAEVTYAAGEDNNGNFYTAETSSVQFLQGRSLRLASNTGTIGQGTTTTWRLQGELKTEDLSGTQNQQNRGRNETRGRPVRNRKPRATSNNNTTKRVKLDNSLAEITTSTQPPTTDIRPVQTIQHSTEVRTQDEAQSIGVLHDLYGRLQREVTAIQGKLSTLEGSNKQDKYDRDSLEKRLFIKHELRRLTKRTQLDLKGERGYRFSSTFRRCPLEFSINCSLQDFSFLAEDLNSTYMTGVRYLPSFTSIKSQIQPLSPKHLVFEKYTTLLDWIGICSREEQNYFLYQSIRRRKNHTLQVMAGAHWDVDNPMRPLNIFVGKSCSRFMDAVIREDTFEADALSDKIEIDTTFSSPPQSTSISTPRTEWDDDNGAFVHQFGASMGATNFDHVSDSTLLDFDAFTVTWRPLPGLRSEDISNLRSERIVVGTLVVFIPSVVFVGESECSTVLELLRDQI